MRRIPLRATALLALAFAALACAKAGAQTQWVEREQLVADPADPAVLRFTVEIGEPGSYQVHLQVRGEAKKEMRLDLELQPESGGPPRTVRFAFTGRGCG